MVLTARTGWLQALVLHFHFNLSSSGTARHHVLLTGTKCNISPKPLFHNNVNFVLCFVHFVVTDFDCTLFVQTETWRTPDDMFRLRNTYKWAQQLAQTFMRPCRGLWESMPVAEAWCSFYESGRKCKFANERADIYFCQNLLWSEYTCSV